MAGTICRYHAPRVPSESTFAVTGRRSHSPRPLRALLLAALLLAADAAAQPATYTKETSSVTIAGYVEDVAIYRPGMGPSAGVAIIAHGFTRSRIRHRDLGRALAEAGVTAVIPDLPNVVDLWGNGDAITELVQTLEAGSISAMPAERSHYVLIGTSAGGLATILAASRLPGLAGWIGLDPVDRTGTGTEAAKQVMVPAVVLLGGASSCNLFGSGRNIAGALPHLLRKVGLKDASHCDFEDPTTNLCRALCGRSSVEMQRRIRDETVRATLELLRTAAASAAPLPDAGAGPGPETGSTPVPEGGSDPPGTPGKPDPPE